MKESKYVTIYKEWKEKIESGQIAEGERLPTESSLMESYQVSRDTVRKSLNLLEQNGYIQRGRGRASLVMPKQRYTFPLSEIASFQEVNKLSNAHAETEVVNLDILQDSHKIKKIFQQSVNGEVYELIRVRRVKDEAVILDKDYFVRDVVPRLPLNECKVSVYRYLEEELGLQISYAVKEITVQKANAEDYELLDMGDYNMVVVVKSHTHLENNTLFQCTESRHRPDKFRFVDLAKRKL
nr:trehalose operon repressor [uncultured Blautia sp.]